MGYRSISVLVLAAAFVGLLGWGLSQSSPTALEIGEQIGDEQEPGGPALPVLDGTERAVGVDGAEELSLPDFRGQWVLVNVWASWCVPCEEEAPELERFYRHNGGGEGKFQIVGIDTKDAVSDGREFVEEFDLTYPQLHDGGGTFADDVLKATGVPESYLLDPDGALVTYVRGPVDARYLRTEIQPLLGGS
ncbi:TlpA family protein disulfide reductase [Thermoleophilia bacterium SCSIO 60948]|nr:TlpA family protein disulfide reductase [Thermoleophilia bacterium SCSIO 60948]